MSAKLDHKQCFKEEYLSQEELVKIVSSLQQMYLKQQDLLSDALDVYEKERISEAKIISDADQEIAKIKEDASNNMDDLHKEYADQVHQFKSELRKLRAS